MTEPQLLKIKAGWMAMAPGSGWAVVGTTEDEAHRNYAEALLQHAEIEARPIDLAEIEEPETGPDPDEGLDLRPEVVERLKRSQARIQARRASGR